MSCKQPSIPCFSPRPGAARVFGKTSSGPEAPAGALKEDQECKASAIYLRTECQWSVDHMMVGYSRAQELAYQID
jgi:hypothetical protein